MLKIYKQYSKLQKVMAVFLGAVFILCLVEIFIFDSFTEPAKDSIAEEYIDNLNGVVADDVSVVFSPEGYKIEYLKFFVLQNTTDRSGTLEIIVKNDDEKLSLTEIRCSNLVEGECYTVPLNFVLDADKSYKLKMNVNDSDYDEELLLAKVTGGSEDEAYLSWGYASKLTLFDKALMALWAFMLVMIAEIINYKLLRIVSVIESAVVAIKKMPSVGFGSIMTFLLTYVILEKLDIGWSVALKLVVATIWFVGAYWAESNLDYVRNLLSTMSAKVAVILLAIWMAFSLVGNYIFAYPIDKEVMIGEIIAFILMTLLSLSVVVSSYALMEYLSKKCVEQNNENRFPLDILVGSIILTMVVGTFYIHAFNPAISNPDSTFCMSEAVGSLRGVDDWNPVFYVLGLKIMTSIWASPMIVAIVQMAFFGFVIFRGVWLLDELGICKNVQYLVLLSSFLSCGNIVIAISIVKDAPYMLAITWLTIIVAQIAFSRKKLSWGVYFELVLAMVGTCMFRQPGVIPGIATGVALLCSFKKNKKLWVSVITSFLIVVLIKGPLYNHFEIDNKKPGSVYSGMGQEILGVYYNGGEVPEKALHIVKEFSYEDIDREFSPYFAKDGCGIDDSMTDFIITYMETFIKNPRLVIRTLLCRTDYLWGINLGRNGRYPGVNFITTEDLNENWTALWQKRVDNIFTEKLSSITTYTSQNELFYIIDWRTGFSTLLIILAAGFLCVSPKKNKSYLIFVPVVAQAISLALSTGWSQCRYSRPINMMAFFIIPISLYLFAEKNTVLDN